MRIAFALVILVGIVCGPVAVAAAQETGTPHLALSQNSWDFGKLWQDEKAEFELTVKNEGTADLTIKEVRTTCGCTVAQPERYVIPPGESTTIKVKYDTHGKQGDVSSKVIIASNDPRRGRELNNDHLPAEPGEAYFNVKGFVKRAITRTPLGGLVIKSLNGEPGQMGTMRLENQMDEPMELKLRSTTIRELDIEIKEVEKGRVYDVIGRSARLLEPGVVRGTLTFTTGLSREPEFSVAARVHILSMVEPVPPAMFVRPGEPKPVERTISFQYYGEDGPANFKLTGVKSSNPIVTVELGPTMPPKPWMGQVHPPIRATADVKMKLPPGPEFPSEPVTVEFTTNIPECPVIKIVVTSDKATFEVNMYGRQGTR